MGYSVLYIAFGIVALWLLGEVLLQYKARLRWRLLAFAGFVGVVGGVALREVVVILLGAIAFGTGQTFVTLSYKRGFSTGWALGGRPGSSRRRKGGSPRTAEPILEVTPVEPDEFAVAMAAVADAELITAEGTFGTGGGTGGYSTLPPHDDSGEYPLYDGQSSYTPDPYTSSGYEGYGAEGYAGWGGEAQPAAAAAGYEGGGYEAGYEQSGWGGQNTYGYDPAGYQEQQPAAAAYDAYSGYGGSNGAQDTNGSGVANGYADTNGYGDTNGYDGYGAQATGDWTPQPHPQHPEGQQGQQHDPYATGQGYGYDPQAQPYIPQQQHQSPFEPSYESQYEPPPPPQPQYTAEPPEYAADPFDPYRY